jgi:signal transduction histidine kinase
VAIEHAERQDVELPLITYSGRHIWVRVSVMPEVVDGSVVRIYGAFQDITEHHLREAQLSTLVGELTKQRDQLEEFAYVISHHLRGPVGNIVSLLDVLGTDETKESSADTIKHIRESSKLLLDTLEDLTNAIIVRHEDIPNLERLQIEDVVSTVADGLKDMIRESGSNITTNVESLPVIEYPRSYFETIIRQLITNSIRFAAPGRPPRIRITSSTDESGQFIEVSDNGLGIDLDKYGEKIFKIRTSFHRGSAGRGVGLFLVKTIVESMGGSVSVHSIIDKGTTFRINFASTSNEGEI